MKKKETKQKKAQGSHNITDNLYNQKQKKRRNRWEGGTERVLVVDARDTKKQWFNDEKRRENSLMSVLNLSIKTIYIFRLVEK